MRTYLAMCSLSLLIGTVLGHLNGKYTAASHFVEDCANLSLVAFRDSEDGTNRRFHCFEIAAPEPEQGPVQGKPAPLPMI